MGEVVRRYGASFFVEQSQHLSLTQRKVLAAMALCCTPAMGAHLQRCDHCGREVLLCNSCGDRHCPKCQNAKRAVWFEKRRQDLLPVEYFHVVFTVPEELNVLAAAHPRVFYDLLLRAVRETLVDVAATPRHLGGQIGGLMVLHTWGQNLWLHPHVHLIVPGGAISPDGQQWLACPRGFFLPVKVLSRVFRGKLLDYLQRAHKAGKLPMTDGQAPLNNPRQFARFISQLYKIEWVVYAKPPMTGGPEKILKYLSRYVHRIAISNDRLESIENGEVTFRYKDYSRGNCWRRMTLPAGEFLRRLSQHILPRGFVRVRAFGFLANGHRTKKLALIRKLLNVTNPSALPDPPAEKASEVTSRCPHCGKPALRAVSCTVRPLVVDMIARTYLAAPFDTS